MPVCVAWDRARVRGAIVGGHLECPGPKPEARGLGPGLMRDITVREPGEGYRKPGVDHRAGKVGGPGAAGGDGASMSIDVVLFANDLLPTDERGQLGRSSFAAGPISIRPFASLRQFGCINAVKPDRDPAEVERISVGGACHSTDILRKSRDCEQQQRGGDDMFHVIEHNRVGLPGPCRIGPEPLQTVAEMHHRRRITLRHGRFCSPVLRDRLSAGSRPEWRAPFIH